MRIFFYAFANTSYIINETIKLSLEKKLNIDWGIIYPRAVYKNTTPASVKKDNTLYLYEHFDEIYNNVNPEDIIFNETNWSDNIYSILEMSKFGYKQENSTRQLKVAYTIYTIYRDFLIKTKPDFVIFPDIEVVNGALLLNICRELNIEVMAIAYTRGMDSSYFARDTRGGYPVYFGGYTDKDLKKAELFVNSPNKKSLVRNQIATSLGKQIIAIKPYAPLAIRMLLSFKNYFRYEKNGIFDTNLHIRLRTNYEQYFDIWRNFFFNNWQKKYFDLKTDKDELPKNFILYLLQVTPESTINTLEQYFIEQEKAIDLIRLNMPSNYYLLVKEHGAMRGMRKNNWYKMMRLKPGVKLVSHKLDTPELIKKSSLVSTITGSVSIECYMADKPIVVFGRYFFSHLVCNFDSFKNFKHEIKALISKKDFDNKNEKIENIAKIYNISYDFFIEELFVFQRVMEKKNIETFLHAIVDHTERLSKYKTQSAEVNV